MRGDNSFKIVPRRLPPDDPVGGFIISVGIVAHVFVCFKLLSAVAIALHTMPAKLPTVVVHCSVAKRYQHASKKVAIQTVYQLESHTGRFVWGLSPRETVCEDQRDLGEDSFRAEGFFGRLGGDCEA